PAALKTEASQSPGNATITGQAEGKPALSTASARLRRPPSGRASKPLWTAATVVVAVLVLTGAALILMNRNVSPPEPAAEEPTPSEASGKATQPVATSADERPAALTGRITYVSEAGDTRPDDGARVIVLPTQRRGTIKFDAAGFMAGSGEVDVAVATAALRALGGDLAIADEKG